MTQVQIGDIYQPNKEYSFVVVALAYDGYGKRIENNFVVRRVGYTTPSVQPMQILPWQVGR